MLKREAVRRIGMSSKDIDELFKTPEGEKKMLTLTYLIKLKGPQDRLPTLADMEVVYERLNERIVFSKWLRWAAILHAKRKQENPFIVRCLTCKQEVDRFDFVQIQSGVMRYFFNITNDDL